MIPSQSLTFTGFTWSNAHERFILLLHGIRACLSVTLLHISDQPRKRHIVNALSALPFIVNLYRMSISSVDQNVLYLLRILLKRCCQAEIIFSGKSIQDCPGKASLVCAGLPPVTTMAPSRILRDLSGIIRSISNSILYPSPRQSGQAPKGLLKEKLLGSISSTLIPQSGQESSG